MSNGERACAHEPCGKPFVPRRPGQLYHDDTCRTRAWRQRKRAGPTSSAPPAQPPPTPRRLLSRQLQTQREAQGLGRLVSDPLLSTLALQEALAVAEADPEVQRELRAYAGARPLRVLADVLQAEELACVDLAELLDPSLSCVGVAALSLPGSRIAVAVVAAGSTIEAPVPSR